MENQQDLKLVPLSEIAKVLNSSSTFTDVVAFSSDTVRVKSRSVPSRIEALTLAFCSCGEATMTVDLKQISVKKNMLVIVHPKNFIMETSISDDFQVKMIMCSKQIIEDIMPRMTELSPLILLQRSAPILELTDAEAENFNEFFGFLSSKLNGDHTTFLKRKVTSVLQALFYEMLDYVYTRNSIELSRKSRKQEIMSKFVLAVSENFKEERQVSYYAEKLCITPKHLSAVVKDMSGMTAGDWIERYVVMEAKMLLKSTDMTIQEISNHLNFTNQSFFGKYFKHQTGYSPSEYRNMEY